MTKRDERLREVCEDINHSGHRALLGVLFIQLSTSGRLAGNVGRMMSKGPELVSDEYGINQGRGCLFWNIILRTYSREKCIASFAMFYQLFRYILPPAQRSSQQSEKLR